MTNRFLILVAALALVAGTGLANAQGTMGRDSGGAGAQPTQHSAQPSGGAAEHGGTMNRSEKGTVGQAGGSSGTMNKNESSEEKAGATKGSRADERAQGQQERSKSMSSENQSKSGTKAEGREGHDSNMKAEGSKSGTSTNNAENRQGTSTNMNAEGRTATSTTVGQAGAGAKLSTEQRTQITSVIHEEHVAPASNVNFAISVGTRVPREGVELHALPSRVVTIYPEWKSYRYILVRDEIVIIDPNTYEIVAVLNS